MRDIRVLVVDDSKVGRLTLMKRLEPLGAQVDTAESGQEALDYLAQARPDVVFMDHMMPDMDGFETTRRIKAAPGTRAIPVIIVSGNEGDEFVMEARAAGADDAIVKPPAAGVLESILASLPEQVAEPVVSAPMAPEPLPVAPVVQPASVPAPVPPSAPSPDQATVHAWVESLLAGSMEHLRDDLMADVGKTLEATFAQQRNSLEELGERWREQGDKTEAAMAGLRRSAAEAADAGTRMHALEQRLSALETKAEAEACKPMPDVDALGQAFQAKLEDHQAQAEQRATGLDSNFNALSADMRGLTDEVRALSDEVQNVRAELDRRIGELAQQQAHMAHAEPTESTPGPDVEALLATMDERIASRLAGMQEHLEALGAELEGQGAQLEGVSLSQNTLQADLATQVQALEGKLAAIAEPHEVASPEAFAPVQERLDAASQPADADLRPPMAQEPEAEPSLPQPSAGASDSSLQAELAQLKDRVKTLTLMLGIGGAVLLATIGLLVFRG